MSKQLKAKSEETSKYSPFFIRSQRVASKDGKLALVLDPALWNDFFLMLKADVEAGTMDHEFAAAISVSISLGARVSEMLSLKVNQIELDKGVIENMVILKKRHHETRMGSLHPIALEIVRSFIQKAKRRPHEYLIRHLDRHAILYRVKKMLPGGDHHALARHSKVSSLVAKNMDSLKLAKRMGFSEVKTAYAYVHLNTRKEIENEYEAA